MARHLAHDLRGATGIVTGALREIEATSDAASFVTLARRATARLERVARSLDAIGNVVAGDAARVVVDIDAVIADALERIQLELRPGTHVTRRGGAGTASVDKAAFVAGVDEVLAVFGKRGKGIVVDGAVLEGVGFDHVPASTKPFADPLGAARVLLERAGAGLLLDLEGDRLRAHVLPAAPGRARTAT